MKIITTRKKVRTDYPINSHFFNLDAGIVLSSQGATHVYNLQSNKQNYKIYVFTPGPPSIVTSVSLYNRVRDDSAERKATKCCVSWEAGGLPVRIDEYKKVRTDYPINSHFI